MLASDINWECDKGIIVAYSHKITRKIKIRNKRKFKSFYKLFWNPFLKTKYLGVSDKQ